MQNKLIDSKLNNLTSVYLEFGTPSKSGKLDEFLLYLF